MDRKHAVELIDVVVKNKQTSDMVIELLTNEGLLVLGYGLATVDSIVNKFTETFGTTKTSKYDRFAANRLATKYGSQSIVGIIDMLGATTGDKYCPVVNNITQLEEKLPSILNYLRKKSDSSTLNM